MAHHLFLKGETFKQEPSFAIQRFQYRSNHADQIEHRCSLYDVSVQKKNVLIFLREKNVKNMETKLFT